MFLRQSTSQDIRIGPFLDITDGVTEETALTLANTDVRLSKDGAAFGAKNSGGLTHDSDGWYSGTLNATDTNTVGELVINVHQPANTLPVWKTYWVLEEAVYDDLFGASAAGIPTVAEIQSGLATAAALTTVDNEIAVIDGVVDAILVDTGTTIPASLTTIDNEIAVIDGNVDLILVDTGTTLQAELDGIQADTEDLQTQVGTAGAGLTAVPWNAAWDAEVQSEVNDALVALGLDHLVGAAVTGTDVVDNSIIAQLVSSSATADWDTYVNTTESLQAIRDRGDASWVTGAGGTPPQLLQETTIATLASQTSFTLTAGSADNDAYNDQICVIEDSVTAVQKAVGIISDYTGSTKTVTLSADPAVFTMAVGDTIRIIASAAAGTAPTAAAVADAVWDEVQADHVTAGSFGEIATEVASILVDTNELQTDDIPGTLTTIEGKIDTIDTNVDAILVDTNELQTDDYPARFTTLEGLIGNIATGTAAISQVAESQLLTTGSEVNTYAVTDQKDGVYHEVSDSAGAMEFYYQFDVGTFGIAESVNMWGRLNGINDTLGVFAWNWAGSAWEQVADLVGSNSSTDGLITFNLLVAHTGTGADLGKVRIRGFAASGLTSATIYIDQAYVGYAQALSTTAIADQVWDEAQADHVAAGSFGEIASEVASILDDTGTSGVVLANNAISASKVATNAFANTVFTTGYFNAINAEVDTALTDYDAATGAEVAALNNLSAADVNAEVVDVIRTDTVAELTGVPAATSTLADKVNWLFMLARNQLEQTSTTATLRADNGATSVATAAVSDDATTAQRNEWA